jgi:hypothetical protein
MILPFNENTYYTLSDLSDITGFTQSESKRILKTWCDFGLLKGKNNEFTLNMQFTKYFVLTQQKIANETAHITSFRRKGRNPSHPKSDGR